MSDQIEPSRRDVDAAVSSGASAAALTAGRIDMLYRLGRHHLFLPFSAMCLAGVLYKHATPLWLATLPVLLQIAVAIATGELTAKYAKRDPKSDPLYWAQRYTFYSGFAGAAWGVGAVIWFVPDDFSAQAFLTVAFLGMTSAEYIARCAHRPAYLAHAVMSLGPLAVMLFLEQSPYATLSCVLVLFFGGVLYSYCSGISGMIDDAIRLRLENADLVLSLSQEKKVAETARDAAETSARAKSAFIANISHEIRTPLNALLGMAQLLERSELDRVQNGHVKVLLEAGRGLKTLLDDVIALSNHEGDEEAYSEEDCDAAQAVRTVARLLQPRAWEKQIRLGVTADTNLPRVAADPRRVRRVLLKLADNAVKFTDRGMVELRVLQQTNERGDPILRFEVCDTGHGLPPEMAGHIFEPFHPGDSSYARHNEGAGLGLAVSKRTVEALGGQIGYESEPGAGATFWFTVPAIRNAHIQTDEAEPIASDAAPPWGLTLLIACVDENVATQLTNLLEPFGNQLTFAANASDAAALISRESFDGVLADAAEADNLAGVLRVHAPLLALLRPGVRAPAAASAVLRWPATAGGLYCAIRDLLGRGAESGTSSKNAETDHNRNAAIDAQAFSALEKSLGLTTLIEILQSYMKTAEDLCAALAAASEAEKWSDAGRIAQDIAGAAGGLGLAALTNAARSFTQCVREEAAPEDLRKTADAIVGEHMRVAQALANLYPDLAA
jgi:signal transduction histidine kinase/HPt (histidine-containing phosphotransfer) domain-containing protein